MNAFLASKIYGLFPEAVKHLGGALIKLGHYRPLCFFPFRISFMQSFPGRKKIFPEKDSLSIPQPVALTGD
jgi:hypothetical protein